MLPPERRQEIVNLVNERRGCSVEELAESALEALGSEYNACLLEKHGVLAVGGSVEAAFEVATMVEYCARIHYQALNIGEPSLLPDEEIDTLLDRFADYGQDH